MSVVEKTGIGRTKGETITVRHPHPIIAWMTGAITEIPPFQMLLSPRLCLLLLFPFCSQKSSQLRKCLTYLEEANDQAM